MVLGLLAGRGAEAQVAGAITVYPGASTLEAGSTKQFTAYVPISPNTIRWLVNDIVGGNTTVGTITAAGLYTPPAVIPAQNVVTIKAQSVPYPTSVGATTLTITRKYPWLWSASPSPIVQGTYTVSFNGANFAPDAQALANGKLITTKFVSSTRLDVSGTAAVGTIQFSVSLPGPGAVTGNSVSVQVVNAIVTVTVAPTSANVGLGGTQAFGATVAGTSNTAVTWSVNGVTGGNSSIGTITTSGVYTAPAVMPSPATVTIRATSVASPAVSAQATVTLTPPPVVVTVSPTAATVVLGQTQGFTATVINTANTAVTWSVNGTAGGSAAVGTISAAGLYTAPAVPPPASTVTVRATSSAAPASFGQATVTISVPPPPPTWLPGARFLEQASFGPTPATIAHVQQVGMPAYLDEQFGLPETTILVPPSNGMGELRSWVLYNYSSAPDQLRQRVAYALSQIIVTSANKLIYADEILPWLRLLSQHAFGNYRDLLHDVTMSPSMGKYLDLANSMKTSASGANENYPRELMQLFSIGLWQLNPDGSYALDNNGAQMPTYSQTTVQQVALALTGWTYATAPGATPQSANWEYFGAPMETRPARHDLSAKAFLGCSLGAGGSVQSDLDGVIDCLMQHPNTAPFVSTRLIRSLVTSNPSPAYVQRVSAVFVDNGQGVRGDLKAVVRAILLDPEARQDAAPPTSGRLKEPILHTIGLLRALNGQFSSSQQLTYLFDYMGQSVLTPPSVFSWFSPLYRNPNNAALFGPEFQIYSATEATLRGNFMYGLLHNPGTDASIDLSPFQPYGNDMAGLVEAVNQALLYGRMPAAMRTALIAAATPGYDAATRIETVLYLTALSGLYTVQY